MTDPTAPVPAQTIYIAPNIRVQTLEEAQDFLEKKRVQRLVMASQHQETVLQKAHKLHGKQAERFAKQIALYDKAAVKVAEMIDKLSERQYMLTELHSELVNIEGELFDARK